MASSAIFLTIIISAVVANTTGFKIINPEAIKSERFPGAVKVTPPPTVPATKFDYRSQPIAGYPKVPPPNAYESGGNEDDLLPPFEDSPKGQFFRRSVDDVKVDPKTGYPLLAQPSWKYAGGDEESLELPLKDSGEKGDDREAVDPKTGYPLFAQPEWKYAGGDGDIIALPLDDSEDNFGQKKEDVDPKTGYPLKADPSWKDAGGNEDTLELPLEDSVTTSGNEEVDPKTGYPLVAQESWKDAGGDGNILQLPLEDPKQVTDSEAVDPKTGYPLVAQPAWKDAGGDGNIIDLPLEDSNETTAVDPKTGYPLIAQPSWRDAGGNGDILQLPLEEKSDTVAVDPNTGYPLVANPSWKEAGGDGEILQPPLNSFGNGPAEGAVDPKTGYPLLAQPGWKYAGGDENILQLPFETPNGVFDGQILRRTGEPVYHEVEIFKLTELQPPPVEANPPVLFRNSFSTPSPIFGKSSTNVFPNTNQKRNSPPSQSRFDVSAGLSRPGEASYTYVGPDNVIVTVTRFLDTDRRENHHLNTQSGLGNFRSDLPGRQDFQRNFQKPFAFRDSSGVTAAFGQPFSSRQPQQGNPSLDKDPLGVHRI